jgi:hypothetical protein
MDFKKSLILLFTILIITQVFALDCQYKQLVFDHIETKLEAYSKDTDDEIEPITYSLTGTEKVPLYFFNENDFNVDIQYDLTLNKPTSCFSGQCTKKVTENYIRTIEPGTNEIPFNYSYGNYISISNLAHRENEFVYLKIKKERIYREECLICGDKNCLDDGRSCEINNECGSGYCIEKICSSTRDVNNEIVCNNKDCNCSINEIEFEDRDCIPKNSVAIGGTPITGNPEECVTNYISSIKKNCAVPLGNSCTQKLDCAENYCVMGTCSIDPIICDNNNCNCKENEIQFENRTCILKYSKDSGEKTITGNKLECKSELMDLDTNICKSICTDNQISCNYGCIEKYSLKNGLKPECGKDIECKSGYINSKTGLCKLNPSDWWDKFWMILLIFAIFILLVGGGYILHNHILILGHTNKIKAKIKLIKEKINLTDKNLKFKYHKLRELENIKHKTKYHLDKIKEYNSQIEKEKSSQLKLLNSLKITAEELEIAEQKVTKPYFSKYARKTVIRIPKFDYYECFYKKNKPLTEYTDHNLVHRYLYRKYNGNIEIQQGEEIHHIDGNKYNNSKSNLIKLRKEQHDRISHVNIIDKESGLEELRKIGIKF